MTHTLKMHRRYMVELTVALLLYFGALYGRVWILVSPVSDPLLRNAVILSPLVPIFLVALACYRYYRRVDEFMRVRLLKAMALTGGATALLTVSWSFLEDVGAPPLSNFAILMFAVTVYGVTTFLYRLDDATSERTISAGGKVAGWIALVAALASGLWLLAIQFMGGPWPMPLAALAISAAALIVISLWIGPPTLP